MHKHTEATPAPIEPNIRGDTQKELEARKQFWSKFKRPAPAAIEKDSIDEILSKPTLILGESTDSLDGQSQPVSQEPPAGEHKELPEEPIGEPTGLPEEPADPLKPMGLPDSQPGVGETCDGKDGTSPEGETVGETPKEQDYPKSVETNSSNEIQQLLPDNQLGDPTLALVSPGTPIEFMPPVETAPDETQPTEGSQLPEQPPLEPIMHGGVAGLAGVAEALKRVSTVDLDCGIRPPQSLVSTVVDGAATVVLIDLGGTLQPVTVPLTKSQCLQAGFKLANAVDEVVPSMPKNVVEPNKPPTETQTAKVEKEQETPQPVTPAPRHDTPVSPVEVPQAGSSQVVPTDDGLEEPNSKQMLKNLYMRFSRSQKRYLTTLIRDLCLFHFVPLQLLFFK